MINKYAGQTVALYTRVSTDDQQNSMSVQDEGMMLYAKSRGLIMSPALVFQDEDVSGSRPILDRPGGKQMIEALKASKAKHLVVYKLDRLGRDAIDVQTTFRYLTEELKVIVHILDMGGDTMSSDGPTAKLMICIFSAFAELELNRIRDRVRSVMSFKRRNGEATGHAPYGWDAVKGKLVPNEGEQRWLRQMFAWRKDGLSYRKIAKRLSEQGARLKKHGQKRTLSTGGRMDILGGWDMKSVYNILNNERNKELYGNSSEEQTPDDFEEGGRSPDVRPGIRDHDGEREPGSGEAAEEDAGSIHGRSGELEVNAEAG